jgi:uncharacterized protein
MPKTIILDTNIFISAVIFGGMNLEILDLIVSEKLKLYVSRHSIEEMLEKMINKFNSSQEDIEDVITFTQFYGNLVELTLKIDVCRDSEGNFLLELTQTVNANYLITRDKDLLSLTSSKWKNTIIIKPEDFLPLVRAFDLDTK